MRYYTLVFSIVIHSAALLAMAIVPVVATDILPEPRRAVTFITVKPPSIPTAPPAPRRGRAVETRNVNVDAAPIAAPDRIQPETGFETIDRGPAEFDRAGIPGGLDGGDPLPEDPPPPPPPPPQPPFRVGGVIGQPQKIRDVAPVYPAIAQAARVEGIVILDAVIGEDGRVRNVRVLRSIPLLDHAAVDAVRQWQFTPPLLNGQPVPVVMTVTVAFQLR